LSRKNEKKKFSDCKNIEQRSIKWLEFRLEHITSEKVANLITLHRAFSFWFYIRVIAILAEHFDCWNPGALKIGYRYFHSLFLPVIKKRDTVLKYLKILNELRLVFFWREGADIILYCPYIEKATEFFVKRRKQRVIENPAIAGDLLARCKLCKVEFKGDPF